jgi:hypothetical protein
MLGSQELAAAAFSETFVRAFNSQKPFLAVFLPLSWWSPRFQAAS